MSKVTVSVKPNPRVMVGVNVPKDATAQLNGVTVGTIPSGGQQSFPVVQNGLPVGTWNGTEWVVPQETPYEVLTDSVGSVHYFGLAEEGTPTSDPWDITRVTVSLDGSQVVETATGPWDDRTTLIYS